jgi:RES domain-containing protein
MQPLIERFKRLADRAGPFSGTLFRSCEPQFANPDDVLTGEGSRRFGGRWNPKGMAAVYGSFTPETAMAETLAYSRYLGLPPQAAMPRTFVAVSVRLACVFDLTIGEHRRLLRVSERRMLETDWREALRQGKTALTHEVAQGAFKAGLEGLIVPSAAAQADETWWSLSITCVRRADWHGAQARRR